MSKNLISWLDLRLKFRRLIRFPDWYDTIRIMGSSDALAIYKQLQEKNIKFLDYGVLAKFTGCTNKNTIYKIADRLIEKTVITRLTDGKFMVIDSNLNDFEIANFLYQPSYISLESALSYYGILAQFSYSVTSVSTKKSKKVVINAKEYSYSTIKDELFAGYVKLDSFLIATREKGLLDMVYFDTKGITKIGQGDLDLNSIDETRLQEFAKKYNRQVNSRLNEVLNDRQ